MRPPDTGGPQAMRMKKAISLTGMYEKRGGIRLFKSWTLVQLRGSGG